MKILPYVERTYHSRFRGWPRKDRGRKSSCSDWDKKLYVPWLWLRVPGSAPWGSSPRCSWGPSSGRWCQRWSLGPTWTKGGCETPHPRENPAGRTSAKAPPCTGAPPSRGRPTGLAETYIGGQKSLCSSKKKWRLKIAWRGVLEMNSFMRWNVTNTDILEHSFESVQRINESKYFSLSFLVVLCCARYSEIDLQSLI